MGWGERGQIPEIAWWEPGGLEQEQEQALSQGWKGEPGEPWICWKIKEPLSILKNKMSDVRLFVLLRCWMCWKPGNTLHWTPWHGYETLHFVGAKVNVPKNNF